MGYIERVKEINQPRKIMNTTAIAQHLGIAAEAIVKIEEWAQVFWVKFQGGCRFVSKKLVKLEGIGNRWTKGEYDRIYFEPYIIAKSLRLSNSKARQINSNKFYYDIKTGRFQCAISGSGTWGVTDAPFSGNGTKNPPYWVDAIKQLAGL